MMARPLTEDHACESTQVEIGLRYLDETPRHIRGPAVAALKQVGLTAKEACEAIRLHNLKLARAG